MKVEGCGNALPVQMNQENSTVSAIKDVLLWGLCSEHFKMAANPEISPAKRSMHAFLAAMEVLPLLGQLISLIEFVVAKFFMCSSFMSGSVGPNPLVGSGDCNRNEQNRENRASPNGSHQSESLHPDGDLFLVGEGRDIIEEGDFERSCQKINEEFEKLQRGQAVDFMECVRHFSLLQQIFDGWERKDAFEAKMRMALSEVQYKLIKLHDGALQASMDQSSAFPRLLEKFSLSTGGILSISSRERTFSYQVPDFNQLTPLARRIQQDLRAQNLSTEVGIFLQKKNPFAYASCIVLKYPPNYDSIKGYENEFDAIAEQAGYAGWKYSGEEESSVYRSIIFDYSEIDTE